MLEGKNRMPKSEKKKRTNPKRIKRRKEERMGERDLNSENIK